MKKPLSFLPHQKYHRLYKEDLVQRQKYCRTCSLKLYSESHNLKKFVAQEMQPINVKICLIFIKILKYYK